MGRSSMQDLLIRIDLSNGKAAPWAVPEQLKGYLGGMGYGTKILVDEVAPQTDPLSAENKLILTVGPLTGTTAPMHPQSCIVTKSPLTGTILNSYAGGFLGAEIRFAGLDGLILEGAAPQASLRGQLEPFVHEELHAADEEGHAAHYGVAE